MRRFAAALAATCVAGAAAVPAVLAGGAHVSDPRGDVKGNPGKAADYDLVKLTSKADDGRLIQKVKVAGKLGDPGKPGPGVFPNMLFDVPGKVGNSFCDYKLQPDPPGTPYNHTSRAKDNLYKCANKPAAPVGSAKLSRTKPDTQKVVLRTKLVGKPKQVGFAAQTVTDSQRGIIESDRAPDRGYEVNHLG